MAFVLYLHLYGVIILLTMIIQVVVIIGLADNKPSSGNMSPINKKQYIVNSTTNKLDLLLNFSMYIYESS